jgi:hypothetical protein
LLHLAVKGPVDLAHAAGAYEFAALIPIGEDIPRLESTNRRTWLLVPRRDWFEEALEFALAVKHPAEFRRQTPLPQPRKIAPPALDAQVQHTIVERFQALPSRRVHGG